MSDSALFIEKLNKLARRRLDASLSLGIFSQFKHFDADDSNDWKEKINLLCNHFIAIDNENDRYAWLKEIMFDLLRMIVHDDFNKINLSVNDIAELINRLASIREVPSANSMVGKVYIAVSSVLPDFITTHNNRNTIHEIRLIELTESTIEIHSEIFKFSWLSSKLTEKSQTLLLRHLLKKSKYELKKFNLFSENAVGFSQLSILFLNYFIDNQENNMIDDKSDSSLPPFKLSYFMEEVYHIMGKYSLDPLRVLDLFLLISLEYLIENYDKIIQFLIHSDFISKGEPKKNLLLTNIVLFNLNLENQIEPEKYWHLTAVLIKFHLIDFNIIWTNLSSTTDEKLLELIEKYESHLEAESMKGIENPLAMAAALSNDMDDDDGNNNNNNDQISNNNTDKDKKDIDSEENNETAASETLLNNPKIIFLRYLLKHGCFDECITTIREFPKLVQYDNELAKFFTRILEYIINPVYEATDHFTNINQSRLTQSLLISKTNNNLISKKPKLYHSAKSFNIGVSMELNNQYSFYFNDWVKDISQTSIVDDLFKISHEYLSLVGPNLAQNQALIIKLCRIGIDEINKSSNDEEIINKWIDYTRKFLFPTIPIEVMKSTTTSEIFNLMKLFPFEKRYFMYNEIITKLSQDSILIKVGFNKAERDAKSILKALSTDTITKESRNLSKLISCNPLATLIPSVKQVENYDKVSELLIYSTRYFNDFAYDVLQYVILLRLTYQRSAVQTDGVNQAPWVQRLAIFIAGLAKNCTQMDISNIIVYVIKTLHDDNIIAVSILKELISTVGGIRDLNEVNSKRLIMLNSGEPLKQEARKLIFDFRDSNVDLAKNLVSLFVNEKCVSEILLLLYNLNLKTTKKDAHYKILSARRDEMNNLLWSFIELIKFCCKGDDFVNNVVPFEQLINALNVSPPWAFHVWRDYMDEIENETEKAGAENEEFFNHVIEKAKFSGINFENFPRELFTTFWKLSLYDIYFDKTLYDELKDTLQDEERAELVPRKKHMISNKIKKILTAYFTHQKTFNHSKTVLRECSKLLGMSPGSETIIAFLQYAIIPRALFTPADAIYSAHFIFNCFETEQTMKIFDILMNSNIIKTLLFSSTSTEAGNLGIFFTTVLDTFENMRKDESFVSYRRQLYEWHATLVRQLLHLLSENNYMSIRNGIEFMKHISSIFPVVDTHIELLVTLLEKNLESEEREDIKLPTNALIGHLKARLKKNAIPLEDFCEMNDEETLAKEQYDSESKEIEQYETMLNNERKQLEIRKKLESNKLRREQEQKMEKENEIEHENEIKEGRSMNEHKKKIDYLANVPKAPSSTTLSSNHERNTASDWPFSKVIRYMEDVIRQIKNNDIIAASRIIPDGQIRIRVENLQEKDLSLLNYRSETYNIFYDYFQSLVHYPQNPEFQRELGYLRSSVSYLTRSDERFNSNTDLYNEGVSKSKKVSRYNSEPVPDKTMKEKKSSGGRPQRDYGETRTNASGVQSEGRFKTYQDLRSTKNTTERSNENTSSSNKINSGRNTPRGPVASRQNNPSSKSGKRFTERSPAPKIQAPPKGPMNNKYSNNTNSSNSNKRSYGLSSDDSRQQQSQKRFRSENNSDYRRNNTSQQQAKAPEYRRYAQQESSNRDRPGQRYGTNERKNNISGSNNANSGTRSNLPQGPKKQSSSGSRYQRY